jgi:hypothetical protein
MTFVMKNVHAIVRDSHRMRLWSICKHFHFKINRTETIHEKKTYKYVAVLISLWLFLLAAQPKEFFLDRLKKLEQQSHKCVELGGNM